MSYGHQNRDTESSPGNYNDEPLLFRPEFDTIFESLRDRHRRIILLLVKSGDVETHTDLLHHDVWDGAVCEVELVHRHLPKLQKAGYIEWGRQTDTISEGPEFDKVEPVLDLFTPDGRQLLSSPGNPEM